MFLTITEELVGQSLHGLLGWVFMILIVLHLIMVLVHQLYLRDGAVHKMWGFRRIGQD